MDVKLYLSNTFILTDYYRISTYFSPIKIFPSSAYTFPPFFLSPRMSILLNVSLIDSSVYNGILSGIPVMRSLFSAFCQRLIPDKECRRCAGVSENICRSHPSCCQSINQDRCCIKQTRVAGILFIYFFICKGGEGHAFGLKSVLICR